MHEPLLRFHQGKEIRVADGRKISVRTVHFQTSAGSMTAVHQLDFLQDIQACRTETAVSVADDLIRVRNMWNARL